MPRNSTQGQPGFRTTRFLAHFPGLDKFRCRGIYDFDKIPVKNTEAPCQHFFRGKHKSLLPGIFTIYCEHGNCLNLYFIKPSMANSWGTN